eukprot:scaffold256064_cov40-Prasinocladus_malaysianus.AAC.1
MNEILTPKGTHKGIGTSAIRSGDHRLRDSSPEAIIMEAKNHQVIRDIYGLDLYWLASHGRGHKAGRLPGHQCGLAVRCPVLHAQRQRTPARVVCSPAARSHLLRLCVHLTRWAVCRAHLLPRPRV